MVIGLWMYDEISFDSYHKNYDRVAQVMQHQTNNGHKGTQSAIPMPLEPELRNKYGGDFKYLVMSSWMGDHILSYKGKKLTREGSYMDVDAPHLLTLKMLKGTRGGLKTPNSILLSNSSALALFGSNDPLNRLVKIDNDLSVMVTGVYEDLPYNTEFHNLSFIAPWKLYISSEDWLKDAQEHPKWDNNSFQLFVQIADHANMEQVSEKIKKAKYDNQDESERIFNAEIFLHPMKDWHLRSSWENGIKSGGLILYVRLFGTIGAFVMILACINFMNLSTAHSERRAKEVGIRKSVGSIRSQLISQFLCESLLVALLSFVLAIVIIIMGIPFFNQLADKQLMFPLNSLYVWLLSLGFVLIIGLLAGSYPALYLSSFNASKILKGSFNVGGSAKLLRKVLVVIQFTVSVSLIIGTIVVQNQIQHSKNRPLGYSQKGTIMIPMTSPDFYGMHDVLSSELKNRGAVVEMAQSSSPLTDLWSDNGNFNWDGIDTGFYPQFGTIWVTHDFGKTIDWEIVQGRDFSRDYSSDSSAFIINETAVKYMGLKDPIGKTIRWGGEEHGRNYKIIGVVKDILRESPFKDVRQTIYLISYEEVNWIQLKLNPDKSTQESLAIVEDVFNEYLPAIPLDYQFVDEEYARKFATEERIGKLSGVFAILAIVISCLGLFGLASFMAERRAKELGIRKVLGASVLNLWKLLSKDFIILTVISSLIAIPISYYVLVLWLQNYKYQTELHWWVFLTATIGALAITLFTVSYQGIKTATANPVISLRNE